LEINFIFTQQNNPEHDRNVDLMASEGIYIGASGRIVDMENQF